MSPKHGYPKERRRGRGPNSVLPREHTAPIDLDPRPAREMCAALQSARRVGGTFEIAWVHQLERTPKGQWRLALEATRGEWEACYHGQPSLGRKLEHAVAA